MYKLNRVALQDLSKTQREVVQEVKDFIKRNQDILIGFAKNNKTKKILANIRNGFSNNHRYTAKTLDMVFATCSLYAFVQTRIVNPAKEAKRADEIIQQLEVKPIENSAMQIALGRPNSVEDMLNDLRQGADRGRSEKEEKQKGITVIQVSNGDTIHIDSEGKVGLDGWVETGEVGTNWLSDEKSEMPVSDPYLDNQFKGSRLIIGGGIILIILFLIAVL